MQYTKVPLAGCPSNSGSVVASANSSSVSSLSKEVCCCCCCCWKGWENNGNNRLQANLYPLCCCWMCGILLYFDFFPPSSLHLAPFVSSCFWISFDPLTNGATTAAVVVAFCFMSFLRIVHLSNCCFFASILRLYLTRLRWLENADFCVQFVVKSCVFACFYFKVCRVHKISSSNFQSDSYYHHHHDHQHKN